eukprot:7177376-Prymnesium_polylepis.3
MAQEHKRAADALAVPRDFDGRGAEAELLQVALRLLRDALRLLEVVCRRRLAHGVAFALDLDQFPTGGFGRDGRLHDARDRVRRHGRLVGRHAVTPVPRRRRPVAPQPVARQVAKVVIKLVQERCGRRQVEVEDVILGDSVKALDKCAQCVSVRHHHHCAPCPERRGNRGLPHGGDSLANRCQRLGRRHVAWSRGISRIVHDHPL